MARTSSKQPGVTKVPDDEFPLRNNGTRRGRHPGREAMWAGMLDEAGTYRIDVGCPQFAGCKPKSIRAWLYMKARRDDVDIETQFTPESDAIYVRVLPAE